VPARNIDLVASGASLVVRQDLHPAIKYLLLQAMRRVHSKPAMFTRFRQLKRSGCVCRMSQLNSIEILRRSISGSCPTGSLT
jgi:hypothetical protein